MRERLEDLGFYMSRALASLGRRRRTWPYLPGKYHVVDASAPVAVATLGSVDLADEIAQTPPAGLCITGKVETENVGIEKVIKNVISNPAIRFLVCAGREPPKHLTGATLMALFRNGIDEAHRIIGAPGMRPVLPNTTEEEVDRLRQTVQPVDLIGCVDKRRINRVVEELARGTAADGGPGARRQGRHVSPRSVPLIRAERISPKAIKLDKAGYFVILVTEEGLMVEHYTNQNELLRAIVGDNARDIYLTIVRNGWVTRLDHAAYLGKELARAEWCRASGLDYTQDGA